MANENDKKNRNKKSSKGLLAIPAVAALALLFTLGDRFGIGQGSAILGNNSEPVSAPAYETAAPVEPSAMPEQSALPEQENAFSYVIQVNEESIIHEASSLSLSELKELILEKNEPQSIWELEDNHAKKALYDQVKAVLTECAVSYIER